MSYVAHSELTKWLPPLPARQEGGQAWIDALRGWRVVSHWGLRGWAVGSWPFVVAVVHGSLTGISGLATYTKGHIEHWAFESTEELYEQMDAVAEQWWRLGYGEAPSDLPAEGLKPHHTGPYL